MLKTCCDRIINTYLDIWHLNPELPSAAEYTWLNHLLNFLRLKHQMRKVFKNLYGNAELEWSDLQDDPRLTKLADMWLRTDTAKMRKIIKDDYVYSTEIFIRRVKKRWPGMDDESVFQALRNIWIMNLIQLLANISVEITDAMFAYSMLYPLTDNILDDMQYSAAEKMSFVDRLGKRLSGEVLEPLNEQESDIFEMVSLIEGQFDRNRFPEVYESILWIHKAQIESLSQQYETLTPEAILKLSFQKGAASVVADGYLVGGALEEQQMDFLVGYGIILQLADDLQDLETDAKNGHQTLFSISADERETAELTRKLCALSGIMNGKVPCDRPDVKVQIEQLLKQSLMFLIHDAIYTHRRHFTKLFLGSINKVNPYGLNKYDKLKKYAGKWFIKLKPLLIDKFQM